MSGLLSGIRLKQAGIPFTIIEKNAEVGGTQFENRVSGLPGRQPQPPLQLFVRTEPRMARTTSRRQPVLLAYFQQGGREARTSRSHPVRDAGDGLCFRRASSALEGARPRQGRPRRDPHRQGGDLGRGSSWNQPRLPDIPGRDDFAGEAFHSARAGGTTWTSWESAWPVVGTGASAFQFVPEVAKHAAQLRPSSSGPRRGSRQRRTIHQETTPAGTLAAGACALLRQMAPLPGCSGASPTASTRR